MVLCPPFRWSSKGGYKLDADRSPPRKQTISNSYNESQGFALLICCTRNLNYNKRGYARFFIEIDIEKGILATVQCLRGINVILVYRRKSGV
ncbi:hypothetical protein EVAR_59185_1 [Eumeta japonica]|uniref:Uncharacterized protein n=1 Tax=Eumeta variegata TaxID=151549 RepID=A0A4C1ZKX3_EUMVA|nr:hypothetical protein EVAR_59185_1 [Eumeta japonica]